MEMSYQISSAVLPRIHHDVQVIRLISGVSHMSSGRVSGSAYRLAITFDLIMLILVEEFYVGKENHGGK